MQLLCISSQYLELHEQKVCFTSSESFKGKGSKQPTKPGWHAGKQKGLQKQELRYANNQVSKDNEPKGSSHIEKRSFLTCNDQVGGSSYQCAGAAQHRSKTKRDEELE